MRWLGALVAVAWSEEWLWDRAVWHDHPGLFPGPDLAVTTGLLALLVPLLALPQATHYVLDAWIWKVRPENPDLRRHLGLPDGDELVLVPAIAGGLLMGAGFLVLFRHHASLGGLNILVLVLQKRFGWRAGWVQMGIDGAILVVSLAWVEPQRIAMSIAGALALNLTLALNHRPGRYVAF